VGILGDEKQAPLEGTVFRMEAADEVGLRLDGVEGLAVGFGEGAELRRPLGIAIIGGLIASQLLTLLTTPVVYVLLDKLRRRGVHELYLVRATP
jgi:hypothetical protein